MKPSNPFLISAYYSPKYFCDREDETESLLEACKSKRNVTLTSLRRMGKTGLIHHVFYKVSSEKSVSAHYLDIMPTVDLNGFVQALGTILTKELSAGKGSFIKKVGGIFKSVRPVIKYDGLTGQPLLSFDFRSEEEMNHTLDEIFNVLGNQKMNLLIALDEFQQIVNYPEKNVEALLRSKIQSLNNATWIFSGSHKHLLSSIFGQHNRPFYQSTDMLHLAPISPEKYKRFIYRHFQMAGKILEDNLLDKILNLSRSHTFYVQYLCNRLFSFSPDRITIKTIDSLWLEILREREFVFYNYRNLLTRNQYNLLVAIAMEENLTQPLAGNFIAKHGLKSPSSVKSALDVLIIKELVVRETDYYIIQDVFLSAWLKQLP